MKWFLGAYTHRFNRRHNLFGHLFSRRDKSIWHGWCLGEKEFKKALLSQMNERMGAEHYGEERSEKDEAKAERIIREELRKRRWKEAELKQRLKGDPEKVKIAQRLRAETVRTVEWIARRIHLGSRNYANDLLCKVKEKKR